MNLQNTLKLAGLCLGLAATQASANQIITASSAGQYSSGGDHNAGNTNYATGAFEGEYRSFFVFNLPTFTGTITSAKLDLFNFGGTDDVPAGFYSEDGQVALSFFKVDTSVPALTAGGSGLTDIFNDLGSGPAYGSTLVTDSSNGQYVSLFLNSTFLANLNTASGNSFALGAALTDLTDPNGYKFLFGNTDLGSASPAVRLTLESTPVTAVPDAASTSGLLAISLLGLVAVRRRLDRQAA